MKRLITLATGEDDLERNLAIAGCFPEVHACIGIHPCDVHTCRDDFETLLEPHLSNPKVAALGETGLDYYHPAPEGWSEEDYHARQRDFLRRHFELASKAQLNVVIHTRDRKGCASLDDALEIYADYQDSVRAVFHCFPGPYAAAQKVLMNEGYLSFTGIVTFKNARDAVDAARKVPLERLMVETDSPYLAPVPHRGKRCEPAYVRETAKAIAEARGMDFEDFIAATEQVVGEFFRC